MTKGSDLLVAALENEGVDRIFALPGEENLDVLESLRNSKIELVLTRHEQAAAFMAATQGRLTGRPGVCLSTLGPGALNFTTAAAYAHLGAMPMLMITGQKAIRSARQARFQIVDIVGAMRPLTKMTRQIVVGRLDPRHRARCVPRRGRRAAGARCISNCRRTSPPKRPMPRYCRRIRSIGRSPQPRRCERTVAMILEAKRPLIMIGAAGNRPRLVDALSDFVRQDRHSLLQHADGQGRRDRRLQPLSRHRGAVGARLRS